MLSKYSIFIFIFIFCINGLNLFAFDVKVLLQKISEQELSKNALEFKNTSGFVFSSDTEFIQGHIETDNCLKVSFQDGSLVVNNKKIHKKKLVISPNILIKDQQSIDSYIKAWFLTCKDEHLDQAISLNNFFEQIVQENVQIKQEEYDLFNDYSFSIISVFLHDLVHSMHDQPVFSHAILLEKATQFCKNQIKTNFLEQLAIQDLTKKDRKKLYKDKKFRNVFFVNIIHQVLSKLLFEFMRSLPRKILHQFLKEEAMTIEFQGNSYLGSFILYQEDNHVLIINHLDIDDYLLSVVFHESWPGWPLEMNKVMAIACRTYLIYQILQSKKINRPYHIESSIKHQTYKGHHKNSKLIQAIQETKDLFIAFEDKPICAMYDACCGGIIPGEIDDTDLKKIPYLARKYPCTFCKNFKVYKWTTSLSYEDVLKRLQKEFVKIEKIVDILVYKKDKAGLVTKINIDTGSKKIIITGKKMYSLFPEVISFAFDINQDSTRVSKKKFVFKGLGYGHHRGMCQWGAMKLIRDEHWTFLQVLQFYYPGTKLMKLTYQR